ncbi:AHH domain-containing protein [Jeongeupia wiesaeckerbachi]|uniref:AHH domain-containing protein n=1 Tax=Jeongeupia wiesaeckerbachi TaxID=3051218 RepID=UPI003D807249
MLGNAAKDSHYLKRIKDATADMPEHPRHFGVLMQAHHIISAEGVKRSGLGKELAQFGYDINLLPNLVFIPSTLQGACHLGVQPHRGNHTALLEADEGDDDSQHPLTYHDMVKTRVAELEHLLTDNCPAEDPDRRKKIKHKMDAVSKSILALIQKAPGRAPLTRVAMPFMSGHLDGCSGVDSVSARSRVKNPCPVGRDHNMKQGPGQKSEGIKYRRVAEFSLMVGR